MYNNNQYLKHYGILGMKWGRRKQGNIISRIRESNAQKKQAKSIYLQNRKKMADDMDRYEEEFDKTDRGKTLLKKYKSEIRKLETSDDWTDSDDQKFLKTEKDYLKGQKEYATKKLLDKYGDEKVSIYANQGKIEKGNNHVQKLIDEWENHSY